MQLLVTVNSRPQLQAVIARMERRAKELGRESSFVSRGRCGPLSPAFNSVAIVIILHYMTFWHASLRHCAVVSRDLCQGVAQAISIICNIIHFDFAGVHGRFWTLEMWLCTSSHQISGSTMTWKVFMEQLRSFHCHSLQRSVEPLTGQAT